MYDILLDYQPMALHKNVALYRRGAAGYIDGMTRQHGDVMYGNKSYTFKCCEKCDRLCTSRTTCCDTQLCYICEGGCMSGVEGCVDHYLQKCPFCTRTCAAIFDLIKYDGVPGKDEKSRTECPAKIASDMELIRRLQQYEEVLKDNVKKLSE
jgi:hypothetical protein